MKPEVIHPRRWSPSRLLIAAIIAYTSWSLSRVLEVSSARIEQRRRGAMGEAWRPWRPGDDPMAVRCMTPEQVADLVRRVRANTTPRAIAVGRSNRQRWERWRVERGRP